MRTISYHIGNSRTLDYLATGDGTSFRSSLEALAKLAGRERHSVGYHINWGQPLKNILLNPARGSDDRRHLHSHALE